jgi:hypothetical protein
MLGWFYWSVGLEPSIPLGRGSHRLYVLYMVCSVVCAGGGGGARSHLRLNGTMAVGGQLYNKSKEGMHNASDLGCTSLVH